MEERVLEILQSRSKENPLSRKELREITKLTDSGSRNLIGVLRDKGYRIVGNRGYYIATSESEYLEWRRLYMSYVKKMLKRVKAMDRYTEGQIEM